MKQENKKWGICRKGRMEGSDGSSPSRTQPAGKLDVLLLYSDTPGMDSTQICVVEKIHQESLGCLLQRSKRLTLPSIWSILGGDQLSNFADLVAY